MTEITLDLGKRPTTAKGRLEWDKNKREQKETIRTDKLTMIDKLQDEFHFFRERVRTNTDDDIAFHINEKYGSNHDANWVKGMRSRFELGTKRNKGSTYIRRTPKEGRRTGLKLEIQLDEILRQGVFVEKSKQQYFADKRMTISLVGRLRYYKELISIHGEALNIDPDSIDWSLFDK